MFVCVSLSVSMAGADPIQLLLEAEAKVKQDVDNARLARQTVVRQASQHAERDLEERQREYQVELDEIADQYEVEGARFLEETQRNCEQEKRRLLDNFERKKAGTVEDIVQAIVSVRL